MVYTLVYSFRISKTYLHLLWMHINIYLFTVYRKVQYGKWVSMLHRVWHIGIFDCLVQSRALNISPIYKVVHIAAIASRYDRFPDKPLYLTGHLFGIHLHKIGCYLPPIYMIDYIFDVTIAWRMQFGLPLIHKSKRNIWMRQCHTFEQAVDITCLRLRCFQKLQSGWRIVKQITYQKCGALWTSYRFHRLFFATIYAVPYPHECFSGFGHHLQLRYRCDTG